MAYQNPIGLESGQAAGIYFTCADATSNGESPLTSDVIGFK